MKTGDQFVVSMAGFDVCYATVESIEDGKATLFIPATRVTMGVKMSLTDLDPETDRVLSNDVSRTDASGEAPVPEAVQETPKSDDISDVSLREVKLDSSAID